MENNNQQLNTDQELEEVKQKAEEYLNSWKRERADFINFKKDEAKRVEDIVKFSNEGLVMEIIEVLDKLDLALKHAPNDMMRQLAKDFEKFLNKYSVEKIKIENKFDLVLYEAVEVEPGGDKLEEVRPGYKMYDKVIRPARVKIIK